MGHGEKLLYKPDIIIPIELFILFKFLNLNYLTSFKVQLENRLLASPKFYMHIVLVICNASFGSIKTNINPKLFGDFKFFY